MAVFYSKKPLQMLKKKLPSTLTGSSYGYGLGGNDITSRPQTIDEQSPIKKSPIQAPLKPAVTTAPQAPKTYDMPTNPSTSDVSNQASMTKTDINLSEQELIKMLEEA